MRASVASPRYGFAGRPSASTALCGRGGLTMNSALASAATATTAPATRSDGAISPPDARAGNDERTRRHAERQRRLAQAHREPASLRREPADDDPPARGTRRRPADAAQREGEGQHDVVRGRRRGDRRERPGDRDDQSGDEDDALTPAVGGGSPEDERQQHPDVRRGRQQPGFGEREAALGVQQRDEIRRGRVEQCRGRLRPAPDDRASATVSGCAGRTSLPSWPSTTSAIHESSGVGNRRAGDGHYRVWAREPRTRRMSTPSSGTGRSTATGRRSGASSIGTATGCCATG